MIDTIRIRIDDVLREDLIKKDLGWLGGVDMKSGNIERLNARYGNINLFARGISLYITVCLPKFYIGNNIDRLTFLQTKEALIKLEKDLELLDIGINIWEGIVTRIDYSACIALENSTDRYFPTLEYCSTFIRNEISPTTSIDFSQKTKRRLKFYDKAKEVKEKREQLLPQNWVDKNILRYELMMVHANINDLFKRDLLVEDLFCSEHHLTLIGEWKKRYDSIVKSKSIQFNESIIETASDFTTYLECEGIKSIGYENVMNLINTLPVKHNQHRRRMINSVKKAMNKSYIVETDLAEELNQKIDEVYQNVKQELIQQ